MEALFYKLEDKFPELENDSDWKKLIETARRQIVLLKNLEDSEKEAKDGWMSEIEKYETLVRKNEALTEKLEKIILTLKGLT